MRRRVRSSVIALAVLALAACGSSGKSSKSAATHAAAQVFAPLPSDPMALTRVAGLVPETAERLAYHVHAHLDVFVNGTHRLVPGGIGINMDDPGCAQACISPLHTHDVSGIVHIESATPRSFTLGQFFTEWGVRLDKNCVGTYCTPGTPVAVYVGGKPVSGDPRTIELTDQREIAIVIGTPPAQIPSEGDFSGG
jgi:hypothetical protein